MFYCCLAPCFLALCGPTLALTCSEHRSGLVGRLLACNWHKVQPGMVFLSKSFHENFPREVLFWKSMVFGCMVFTLFFNIYFFNSILRYKALWETATAGNRPLFFIPLEKCWKYFCVVAEGSTFKSVQLIVLSVIQGLMSTLV